MVLPVGVLLIGALLLYAGLHNQSVTDVIRVAVGQKPRDTLGSLSPNTSSSSAPGTLTGVGGGDFGGTITGKPYGHLSVGRVDQGLDFGGSGPVGAVFPGVVIQDTKWPGWPGTGGMVYRTAHGNIYVEEDFAPSVHVGQHVNAGDVIGDATGGGSGIETGYANAAGTGPLTPYNGAPDGTPMPGGNAFKRLLGY